MHANAQEIFVCPGCRGSLRLHASESVIIETGTLECSSCGAVYPVRRGVPRFVSTESYADTFGRQWTRWARTQHDSLNETTIFRGRMQRYTGWTPESMSGKVVVDAGCGPGGFIDVIEEHAKLVIGFDLSCAIDAAYELHGRRPNVHLAQADIFRSPLPDGVADRVYTFGVVQHTEDPESAFRSLIRLVRPGGEIAVWVYRRSRIPQPLYLVRRFTAGMSEPRATRFIEWYVPKAYRVSGMVGRVPVLGRYLRRLIPVADYRDRRDERRQLSSEQMFEWALMDTHDMLITRYTYPQRWEDLQRWMRDLEGVRRPTPSEMAAVATKPA